MLVKLNTFLNKDWNYVDEPPSLRTDAEPGTDRLQRNRSGGNATKP